VVVVVLLLLLQQQQQQYSLNHFRIIIIIVANYYCILLYYTIVSFHWRYEYLYGISIETYHEQYFQNNSRITYIILTVVCQNAWLQYVLFLRYVISYI